jgi:hypothetical protein
MQVGSAFSVVRGATVGSSLSSDGVLYVSDKLSVLLDASFSSSLSVHDSTYLGSDVSMNEFVVLQRSLTVMRGLYGGQLYRQVVWLHSVLFSICLSSAHARSGVCFQPVAICMLVRNSPPLVLLFSDL